MKYIWLLVDGLYESQSQCYPCKLSSTLPCMHVACKNVNVNLYFPMEPSRKSHAVELSLFGVMPDDATERVATNSSRLRPSMICMPQQLHPYICNLFIYLFLISIIVLYVLLEYQPNYESCTPWIHANIHPRLPPSPFHWTYNCTQYFIRD